MLLSAYIEYEARSDEYEVKDIDIISELISFDFQSKYLNLPEEITSCTCLHINSC